MGAILARLTSEPIPQDLVLRELGQPGNGAQLVFTGVVRDHNEGRRVVAVTYDAYPALAEKTFRDIAEEALVRWRELLGVVVIHRTGRLEVGEASVVIGVGAAHRDTAYEASRYAIEQIKARSPVWKKEHYVDGDSEWLSGHPLRTAASGR